MATKKIYLLRHGKIVMEEGERRYLGQSDPPLSEEGIRQAERLQAMFRRTGFAAVYASDLARSRDTAKILAASAQPVITRSDLREISLGEWEGRTFAEIARKFPEEFAARGRDIAYYRTPGGENFADCSKRSVAAFLQIAAAAAEPTVIVGHAGVNRVLLCHLLGMPLANLFRISQEFACINVIQLDGKAVQVKAVNWIVS